MKKKKPKHTINIIYSPNIIACAAYSTQRHTVKRLNPFGGADLLNGKMPTSLKFFFSFLCWGKQNDEAKRESEDEGTKEGQIKCDDLVQTAASPICGRNAATSRWASLHEESVTQRRTAAPWRPSQRVKNKKGCGEGRGGWVREGVRITLHPSCCCPESKPWRPGRAGLVPLGYPAWPSQSPCSGRSWWWPLGEKQRNSYNPIEEVI